jgi:hypothetical protein
LAWAEPLGKWRLERWRFRLFWYFSLRFPFGLVVG